LSGVVSVGVGSTGRPEEELFEAGACWANPGGTPAPNMSTTAVNAQSCWPVQSRPLNVAASRRSDFLELIIRTILLLEFLG
jgi:hypothetical protein